MESQDLLRAGLFDNLRKLINIVDELRDVGLQEYIQLPRIAVVGTQSSGKSSLLENIVGLDFLPRGSGVVTRRPLELRLIHEPESNGKIAPWGVFDEMKDKRFTDFDQVRQTIEALTDKIAGANKGIVDNPIKLTIHSNECPDLTLIDLPGITRINIADQIDIEKVTKAMATRYISDERTVILAVLAANQDITTSDGLQLARQIDTAGKRTIGCITKIDIMDQGTDARGMLTGQEVSLDLGYVGIKNRSQQDIINKVKVKRALEMEQEFFSKHPVYSKMDPKYLGTKALVNKLTTVLFYHIREFLPKIVVEIREKIRECEDRLKELGPTLPADNRERQHLIYNMIAEFTDNFKNQIMGKYDPKRGSDMKEGASGGAVIKTLFNELYSDQTQKQFRATSEYSDKDIQRAIDLHQGDSIPGFPSIGAFLYLVNPQLEKLKDPAFDTLQQVYGFLENLANKIIKKVFQRFPPIMDEISDLASKVLQDQREKAKQILGEVIEAEQGYLFTNDVEYLINKTQIIPRQELNAEGKPLDPKKVFQDELRSRVDSYYQLVIRNIRDSIPKTIGYFLVRASQNEMQYQIYNEMIKKQDNIELLNEPQHIREERETITKTLSVLRNAIKVLKRDPDLAPVISKAEKIEKQILEAKTIEQPKHQDAKGTEPKHHTASNSNLNSNQNQSQVHSNMNSNQSPSNNMNQNQPHLTGNQNQPHSTGNQNQPHPSVNSNTPKENQKKTGSNSLFGSNPPQNPKK